MTEQQVTPESTPPRANLRVVDSDMLSLIFEGQRSLMQRYHEIEKANGSPVILPSDQGDLDSRQVQARLHQLFGFALGEWAEAMQELRNKPWRQTSLPTDRGAFVEEVGDVFHFFVEFCITSGISAQELHDSYFRKHQENQRRQQSQY